MVINSSLTNKDFYNTFSKLLLLFLLTRFVIFILGIFPDSDLLSQMWQILNLELLENNFDLVAV